MVLIVWFFLVSVCVSSVVILGLFLIIRMCIFDILLYVWFGL